MQTFYILLAFTFCQFFSDDPSDEAIQKMAYSISETTISDNKKRGKPFVINTKEIKRLQGKVKLIEQQNFAKDGQLRMARRYYYNPDQLLDSVQGSVMALLS